MQTIFRTEKNSEYFIMSNFAATDKRLSFESRGLLAYLLSKPEDWRVMIGDLMNQGNVGKTKIRRMIKELEDNGYVTRHKRKDKSGKWFWDTVIKDYMNTIGRLPVDGSPVDGSPVDGKPDDIQSNELTKHGDEKIIKEVVNKQAEKQPMEQEKENNDNTQTFRLLFDRFILESGIPETMLMNPSNIENVKTWVESGITEEDIAIAVKELRDKDYSIVRPASINTALNHIKSRNYKKKFEKNEVINDTGEIYA